MCDAAGLREVPRCGCWGGVTDWYKEEGLRKLQKEWYAKLKEDGFRDIEGGVEGPLLQGPTPSVQLGAALSVMGGRLARAKGMAGGKSDDGTPKSDRWYDAAVREHFDRGKASYYNYAQHAATLSFHTRVHPHAKYAWSMHSDGLGENVIASELGISRPSVRKYLVILREKIHFLLDKYANTE